jgi:hypothetical protein
LDFSGFNWILFVCGLNLESIQIQTYALFAWLISHQPAVLLSHNKPATSNQPAVLFSQNKPVPAISHQPTEQAVTLPLIQLNSKAYAFILGRLILKTAVSPATQPAQPAAQQRRPSSSITPSTSPFTR